MIPDFKTYLKESVWGSIRKKSLGLETRIEDDVNKLDGEAFVGYIKQHYECVGTEYEPFIDVEKCITVPLFVVSNKTQFLSFNEKIDTVYLSVHSMLRDNPVYDQLRNEFSVEEKAYSYPGHFTKDDIIRPKMGYGSKKFFLEVIDFLLKNTGEPFKPLLIKKDSVYESVWGDIRKKSIGQEERKETSIDEYSIDNFFKYLKDTYDTVSESYLQTGILNSGSRYINTTIFVQGQNYISLFYNDGRKDEIYLNIMKHEKFEPLVTSRITAFISIIKDVFVVRNTNPSDKQQEGYGIKASKEYPKGRNTLYRKVLNMAIIAFSPKTKKDSYMAIKPKDPTILNESVWGNIRKKSLGQEERLEDDVNLLDKEGFYQYLLKHYEPVTDEVSIKCGYIFINIPLFTQKKTVQKILLNPGEQRIEIRKPLLDNWPDNIRALMFDKYKVVHAISDISKDHMYYITPREGEGDNKFFIDVIETILDNTKKPFLKRSMNESVWGDIRKKSIGQEIREEDNINNLDGRAFVDYLKQQYDSPMSSSRGDSFVILYRGTITILLSYILDSAMMKTGDYEYLFYDLEKNVIYISEYSKIYKHPIFKKLCNKFDVKKKAYKSSMSNDTTIKPKNGDTSKRFFMELIDFFIV